MRFGAAVLRAYGSPFTLEEVVLAEGPAEGEVLVRIAGCGMCRTDLAVRRSAGRSALPAVLGHEGAGVVVETGGTGTGPGVGDHVVLSFDSCGHCLNCKAAAPAYCDSFAALNLFGGAGSAPHGSPTRPGPPWPPAGSGSHRSPSTRWFRPATPSGSIPHCPWNCSDRSAAASSPAPARSSTPSASAPVTPSPSSARARWAWPR